MEKVINIDGVERRIVANALLPKKYRYKFGRDLLKDLQASVDSYNSGNGFDEEALARLAWLMLREGGEDVGESVDDWLSSIDNIFGLYEILPEIVSLWTANSKTTSKPKKK